MSQAAKPVRFLLVFFGLTFFFNPYFAVVDVLPDFIGCLLICAGLSKIALLQPDMRDARKAFLKLAAVDIVKTLSLPIIFGMGNQAEQPTALLLVAFSAAVLEMMFLVPAVKALFEGFSALATHYDRVDLYENLYGTPSRTERMQRITVVFLFFREAVCLLPEFTALTVSSYNEGAWMRLYDHIGIMRSLACAVVLLFGLYWLVRLWGYHTRLHTDARMAEDIGARYALYYKAHPGIGVTRRQGSAFLLLTVGGALLTDFYLDFFNVLPDLVAGLFLLAGCLIPAVDKKWRLSTAALAAAYTGISAYSSALSYDFSLHYTAGEIGKNAAAEAAYNKMWLCSLAEFAVFLGLLVMLLLLMRQVIIAWAGYRPQHPENGGVAAEDADEETKKDAFVTRNLRAMRVEFDGKLITAFVFGFISGLFSFLFDYIKTVPGKGWLHLFEYAWMFDFCAAVCFAVCFGALLWSIYGEIKQRYQYD